MARILRVEDEHKMDHTLAQMLRKGGYAAAIAADGRSFDLPIVDATRAQRGSDRAGLGTADTRILALMLTTRGQIEDRMEGLDASVYLP
jgi:DNA-binding response OmpR family regulator